jgi:hypothetical protein
MRRCWIRLSLFLPLFLGCAGKNIVAGEEKTKAEQLESTLPSWCHDTCERFLACPPVPCLCEGDVCNCAGIDSGCEKQCPKAFEPYLDAGEGCAAVGQRVQDCFDAIGCSDLGGSDPCPVTDAERALCLHLDDDSDNLPSGSNGPSAGPTVTAGTASIAGTASSISSGGTSSTGGTSTAGASGTGGASAGMNPVSCQGSYGTGGGAYAAGNSQVTCEEGRMGCSDGHEYSWICTRGSQGQRACSCLIDEHTTAGFEPVMDCPDVSAVNAGCGWALLP